MNRHTAPYFLETALFLEAAHALLGSTYGNQLEKHDGKRCIGVDRLTGTILERRFAIEATR